MQRSEKILNVSSLILLLLSVLVRLVLFPFESDDYTITFSKWFAWINAEHQSQALASADLFNTINYSPVLVYLFISLTYLPFPCLWGMKAVFSIFDYLCAFYAYRLLCYGGCRPATARFAVAGLLFIPTLLLNASLWGQCDSMYSSFMLAALYYVLQNRPRDAAVCYGISLAMKPWGLMLLPVFLILWHKKALRLVDFVLIPMVYVCSCLPGALLDAPLGKLLLVYFQQPKWPVLTFNCANIYQWISSYGDNMPHKTFTVLWRGGMIFAVAMTLFATTLVFWRYPSRFDTLKLIKTCLLYTLLIPFVTPGMHERYYFMADLLSFVLFVIAPRYWKILLFIQLGSLLSYIPFLFHRNPLSKEAIVFLFGMALVWVIQAIWSDSNTGSPEAPAVQV